MSLTQNTTSLQSLLETINSLPDYVDTSGTAVAADIYTGKTATVNNAKVTGTNPYNAANVDPAVTSALAALAEKGVDTTGAGLANLATLIAAIEAGGGGDIAPFSDIIIGTITPAENMTSLNYTANNKMTFFVIGQRGSTSGGNAIRSAAFMRFYNETKVVDYGAGSYSTKNYPSLTGVGFSFSPYFLEAGVLYWYVIGERE